MKCSQIPLLNDWIVEGILKVTGTDDLRPLNEGQKRALLRLLDVLERFRKLRQTIPVHQVTALLRVALNQGQTVISYARESEVSQSVMSRHLRDIGTGPMRDGGKGFGLVVHRHSSHSLREYEIELSEHGLMFVAAIADALGLRPEQAEVIRAESENECAYDTCAEVKE